MINPIKFGNWIGRLVGINKQAQTPYGSVRGLGNSISNPATLRPVQQNMATVNQIHNWPRPIVGLSQNIGNRAPITSHINDSGHHYDALLPISRTKSYSTGQVPNLSGTPYQQRHTLHNMRMQVPNLYSRGYYGIADQRAFELSQLEDQRRTNPAAMVGTTRPAPSTPNNLRPATQIQPPLE